MMGYPAQSSSLIILILSGNKDFTNHYIEGKVPQQGA